MMRHLALRTVTALLAVLAGVLLLPGLVLASESPPNEGPGRLTPNQLFGGRTLTSAEALAACGPAAAVAFANATGRAVSLDGAVAVARQVGWTASRGMTGPYGQLSLLNRLNIPATLEAGLDPAKIRSEVQAGRPVIIRTAGASVPGHYFVAERVDPVSGQFDLAQSALVLRAAAGRRWFSLSEIGSLGVGVPTHAIYLASQPASQPAVTLTASSVKPPTAISAAALSAGPATSRAATTASAGPSGSRVVATGGPGARLRAAPGTTTKILGALADGARVTPTGATATVAGRVWQRVLVAGGGAGWMDGSLLRGS